MKLSTFLKKWSNVTWETYSNEETMGGYKKFFADLKTVVKDFAKEHDWDEVILNPNWYTASGFIRKGDKWVYYSVSDLRYFEKQWRTNVLIRTAEDNRDYIGGNNQYTTLDKFADNVDLLFEGRSSLGRYNPWNDGSSHFYKAN